MQSLARLLLRVWRQEPRDVALLQAAVTERILSGKITGICINQIKGHAIKVLKCEFTYDLLMLYISYQNCHCSDS
jgi:hypothetical protein